MKDLKTKIREILVDCNWDANNEAFEGWEKYTDELLALFHSSLLEKLDGFKIKDALRWSDKHKLLTSEGARVVHIQQLLLMILGDDIKETI